MRNKKGLLPILLVPSLTLLIPLGAMLCKVDGWAWQTDSFIFAWLLMAGVGLAYRFLADRAHDRAYRAAAALALAAAFILVWINGAVGLIGGEDNPANLMYGAVLAIGVIGAVRARLRSDGLALTLSAAALAQFLVPVIALIVRRSDFSPGIARVFALNFFFVLLFAGSALLFRRAARQGPRRGSDGPGHGSRSHEKDGT